MTTPDANVMDLSCDEDMMALAMFEDCVAPQLMLDTTTDVLAELLRRERDHRPDGAYLHTAQRDGMEASWRERIADWMVAIAAEFKFGAETTDLALNYLDRYLSKTSVSQHNLQLIGLVALLIASKFHEPDSLLVAEAATLAHLAGFTPEIIRAMETSMLGVLQWNLHVVVPIHFVDCFVAEVDPDASSRLREACHEFLAVSRVSYEVLAYLPSEVAVAVVTLAYQFTGTRASCDQVVASLAQLLPANTATRAEQCLEHLAQQYHVASAGVSAKRDRSPSPLGVDDLDLVEFIDDHQPTFCPVVKRPKCHA